jgi:outer membrane protein insertion porin family
MPASPVPPSPVPLSPKFFDLLLPLALISGSFALNLGFATAGWGQSIAPSSDSEVSSTSSLSIVSEPTVQPAASQSAASQSAASQITQPAGTAALLLTVPFGAPVPDGAISATHSQVTSATHSQAIAAPSSRTCVLSCSPFNDSAENRHLLGQASTPANPNNELPPVPTTEPVPGTTTNPGETPPQAPAGQGQVISEIQVRFIDRDSQPTNGLSHPRIITREFELQPGAVYDQRLAQEGVDRVSQLNSIRQASVTLEPTTDSNRAVMVVTVQERNPIAFTIGGGAAVPSALQGPFQPRAVGPGPNEASDFSISGSLQFVNVGGTDQDLILRLAGGDSVLDGEIRFVNPWIGDSSRTGYAVNIFNQRAVPGVFDGGDPERDLPNGDNPWVHRLGGGLEVFRPLTPDLIAALGVSYQRVSVRDDYFSDRVFSEDERGNALTVDNSGQDDLLTLNFAADFDRRDDVAFPNRGYRIQFGADQALPIGDADIAFTRFSANYSQYLPLRLFGFAEGPRTLVFNLQAGTMFGDVPGYEAFDLGSGPVGQFGGNEFGTGSSFVSAVVEYRFPIANFTAFRQDIELGGALFTGYITDLGTASDVIGSPADARRKPGDGLGAGVGIRARTPLGLFRLDFGFSNEGTSSVVVTTGDRF